MSNTPVIPMDTDDATTMKQLMRLTRRKLASAIIHDREVIRVLRKRLADIPPVAEVDRE